MFLLFRNYLPLKKGGALYFHKLEPPSPKDALIEIGSKVVEKKIFKTCQCIFSISYLSPLENGCSPLFKQTGTPFTYGSFVPSMVEIGFVVLEKKVFKFFQCVSAIS